MPYIYIYVCVYVYAQRECVNVIQRGHGRTLIAHFLLQGLHKWTTNVRGSTARSKAKVLLLKNWGDSKGELVPHLTYILVVTLLVAAS